MGVDHVTVYYGLRFEITDEAEVDQLEAGSHPLIVMANKANLEYHWGPLDRPNKHYLLISIELGSISWEDDEYGSMDDTQLLDIMETVQQRLRQTGFTTAPCLHMQLEPNP